MRKTIVMVVSFVMVLCMSGYSYGLQAQGQLQCQEQEQQQGQGQLQGQALFNKNKSGSQSGSKSDATSGSKSESSSEQSNTQKTTVEGDEVKYYSSAWPALSAQKGVSPLNAYSIFGGVGISQTEEYQQAIEKIKVVKVMEEEGYLTRTEAIKEAREAFLQLKDATAPQRLLGILWRTKGDRNLLNGLGLLDW